MEEILQLGWIAQQDFKPWMASPSIFNASITSREEIGIRGLNS